MKAIFFDLDGTLLHFTRDYREILEDTFRTVVGEVRDEWIDTYNEVFFELFEDCESDVYQRSFASTTVRADPSSFVEVLRDKETKMCQPPEGATDDLERLSGEYKLGVLTNGVAEWQTAKLEAHGLASHFDTIVASYDVGAHKPALAPFRAAQERLPADAYAMVGDGDADIHGAQEAGWCSYRYHGQGFSDLPEAINRG